MSVYRKLGRPTASRLAMLRSLTTSLLASGKIATTVPRAKEVRRMAEKMITIAKKNTLHARRQVLEFLTVEDVVTKLFSEIAPKYETRNGGYTRITRTWPRRGDAAMMCVIELV
jgi:large subunit ribosomal protein L17